MKFPKTTTPEWFALKRRLVIVSQVGAFLLTAFGGFYSNIAPPDDHLRFFPSYASLVAGLIFLVSKRFGRATKTIMWFAIVFAIILPLYYFSEYQELTATYNSSRRICGTQYTTRGAAYVSKHPNIGKDDLLFAFGGKVEDIWTENSINRARMILGVIYSAGFGFLALALLAGLQETKKPPHAPNALEAQPAPPQ